MTFTADNRLHRRGEFVRVQRTGVRSQTDHFILYAAPFPETPGVRLGTTISRRLGNAVVRNRTKRRIREYFRLDLRFRFPAGTAIVVIGRPGAGQMTTPSMRAELNSAAAKLRRRLHPDYD